MVLKSKDKKLVLEAVLHMLECAETAHKQNAPGTEDYDNGLEEINTWSELEFKINEWETIP